MIVDKEQAAKDLRAAAKIIEKRGWIQKKSISVDGVCAFGAIRCVQDSMGATILPLFDGDGNIDIDSCREYDADEALKRFLGFYDDSSWPYLSIAAWNDDETTTKELVVKSMRAAADAVEANEI